MNDFWEGDSVVEFDPVQNKAKFKLCSGFKEASESLLIQLKREKFIRCWTRGGVYTLLIADETVYSYYVYCDMKKKRKVEAILTAFTKIYKGKQPRI